MNRIDPGWLPETRDLCRLLGITIMAWGPDLLTVEAKSATRAKEIAAQLGHLGFKAIENDDEAYAGMLSLSRNPDAVRAQVAACNVSRRRWDEQIEPLIWAGCAIGFFISGGALPILVYLTRRSRANSAVLLGCSPHLGMAPRDPSRHSAGATPFSLDNDSMGPNSQG